MKNKSDLEQLFTNGLKVSVMNVSYYSSFSI